MSESRFETIAILDAIPEGHLNSARPLRDDLETLAVSLGVELTVRYYRVDDTEALTACVADLEHEFRESGKRPLLHFEGHGFDDDSGIQMANGDKCTWAQLREVITPLNVSMGLNLLVVFAACYGGSFISAIRTTDRAPVWGLIGPFEAVPAGEIQTDFAAFYSTFLRTASGAEALKALNTSTRGTRYRLITAQEFFYAVWRGYKITACADGALSERARAIRKDIKRATSNQGKPSVGRVRRMLRTEEPKLFDQYRDNYFMIDRYPMNRPRFPVTYSKAEQFARADKPW